MTTAEQIKALMAEHGLTRRQTCELFGFNVAPKAASNSTLDNWLSGTRNPPPYAGEFLRLKLRAAVTVYAYKTDVGTRYHADKAEALERADLAGVIPITINSAEKLAKLLNRMERKS